MTKIIAELSMNFLGDMGLAKEMVQAAAESGADYAKVQTWEVGRLVPGKWDTDGRKEDYIKSELSNKKCVQLVRFCEDAGIKFLSSCFSELDLYPLRQYSNEVKIPGPESSNVPLVEKSIEMFDTVYLSTGASNLDEFARYVKFVGNVYLMHCVSCYPCPDEYVNMPRMLLFKEMTDKFGYSGHSDDIWDAILAISHGAKVIEKHFTTDRNLPFKDNKFSILPEDLAAIRKYADVHDKMMIDRGHDCQEIEMPVRTEYARRWCGGINEKLRF